MCRVQVLGVRGLGFRVWGVGFRFYLFPMNFFLGFGRASGLGHDSHRPFPEKAGSRYGSRLLQS